MGGFVPLKCGLVFWHFDIIYEREGGGEGRSFCSGYIFFVFVLSHFISFQTFFVLVLVNIILLLIRDSSKSV